MNAQWLNWQRRARHGLWIPVLVCLLTLLGMVIWVTHPAPQPPRPIQPTAVKPQVATVDSVQLSQQRLQQFDGFVRQSAKAQPEMMAILFAAADHSRLSIERADYQWSRVEHTQLVALNISIQLKGSYSQLSQFAHVLRRNAPAAAIQRMTLVREATQPEGVYHADIMLQSYQLAAGAGT